MQIRFYKRKKPNQNEHLWKENVADRTWGSINKVNLNTMTPLAHESNIQAGTAGI